MVRLREEGRRGQRVGAGVLLCCVYSFFYLPPITVGYGLSTSYYLYLINK